MGKFESHGAQVVAISVDPPEKTRELATKQGLTFPLLSDPSLGAIRAYGVEDVENGIAWPAIFIVSREGTIRWRSLVETFTVRPTSDVVLDALGTAERQASSAY